MICNNCGSSLSDIAKFCSACGCSTSPGSPGIASQSGNFSAPPSSPAPTQFSAPAQPLRYEQSGSLPPQPVHYQNVPPNPPFTPPPPSYQYQIQVNPYVQPVYAKRKEPGIALLLSFLLPGLGQIYNGDIGKGIGFMIGFWVLIWVGIGIVFWIWGMIDAYQVATNINLGRRL